MAIHVVSFVLALWKELGAEPCQPSRMAFAWDRSSLLVASWRRNIDCGGSCLRDCTLLWTQICVGPRGRDRISAHLTTKGNERVVHTQTKHTRLWRTAGRSPLLGSAEVDWAGFSLTSPPSHTLLSSGTSTTLSCDLVELLREQACLLFVCKPMESGEVELTSSGLRMVGLSLRSRLIVLSSNLRSTDIILYTHTSIQLSSTAQA